MKHSDIQIGSRYRTRFGVVTVTGKSQVIWRPAKTDAFGFTTAALHRTVIDCESDIGPRSLIGSDFLAELEPRHVWGMDGFCRHCGRDRFGREGMRDDEACPAVDR